MGVAVSVDVHQSHNNNKNIEMSFQPLEFIRMHQGNYLKITKYFVIIACGDNIMCGLLRCLLTLPETNFTRGKYKNSIEGIFGLVSLVNPITARVSWGYKKICIIRTFE